MKLKECFDIFEHDQSGNISAEGLVNTIRALGIENQAQQFLGIVQSSSSTEEMDLAAFLEVFGFGRDVTSEVSLGQLFLYFDVNKQGAFGPEEFQRAAASVG